MAGVKFQFATRRRYDTKFLMDGAVRIDGMDIDYVDYRGPGGMTNFFRSMVTDLPYEIGEQAFAHYLIARDQGKPLTAIPVFPSRFFPHLGVSVRKGAGIETAQELVAKRVAASDWGFNPAVWMRGILAHQYEVPIERITWIVNEQEPLFKGLDYPHSRRFKIEKVRVDDNEAGHGFLSLLEAKEIDAVFLAAGGIPPTEGTRKLFENPHGEIRRYIAMTGVFPINTVITLKESAVKSHPELPGRLMEAWQRAQRLYEGELNNGKETDHMGMEVETLKEMGVFPAQYGLAPNRRAISMMIQYCYEQGLIRTLIEPEELFTPTES